MTCDQCHAPLRTPHDGTERHHDSGESLTLCAACETALWVSTPTPTDRPFSWPCFGAAMIIAYWVGGRLAAALLAL